MTRWHRLVTRRIGIQVAQQWNHAFLKMRKPYGIGIDRIRVTFDGQKAEYFVDADQWRRFQAGMRQKLNDKTFVRRLAKDARHFLESQSARIRHACKDSFSKMSDTRLRQRFDQITAMADDYYTRMWLVFLINEPLADAVERTLRRCAPDFADQLLLAFSSPLAPNDAIRERQSLLRIAMEKNPRSRDSRLKRHAAQFAHIPVFDFNHEPYALSHFSTELKRIRNPKDELATIDHAFRQRRRNVPRMRAKLKIPENGLKAAQIRLLSELAFLRDYRDSLRQKMNLALRNLYGEIAARAGMSIAQVSLLSKGEIVKLLAKPEARARLKKTAQDRRNGFALVETPHRITIQDGKQKTKHRARPTTQFIRGICANPGTATGTVRVVLTNLDLDKVRKGEVMIATMTRQDFVPYIRRCAALVTDEGGVTCHAAIIARELGLPCIVGTKNATRILNDGQNVTVDGRHGTVSKMRP